MTESNISEWFGLWWRPESPEHRNGGRLIWDSTGGHLELALGTEPNRASQRAEVMHGLVTKGGESSLITILGATYHYDFSPDWQFQEWEVEAVLEGCHAETATSDTQARFAGCQIGFDQLSSWANSDAIDVDVDKSRSWFTVRGVEKVLHKAALDSGETVELREFDSLTNGKRNVSIERHVAFVCRTKNPSTWQEICNLWIRRLESLLWCATGSPSAINRLEMVVMHSNGVNWSAHRLWASLIQPKSSARPRRPQEFLFTAQTFPGGFDDGITKWCQIVADLKHVIEPVVAREHSPFIFGDDRLLTAVAAFDAYSMTTQTSSSVKRLKKKRTDRLKSLIQEESEEFQIWAKEAARNSSNPLRNRMSATLNLVPNLVNDLVGTHKDAFLVEVNRARNSQAHALHSNSRFHDQDGGLYFAAETLNWLLRVMLLIELGFTAEDAEQAVQGNSSFKFVAKWMKSFMANFAEMSTESQDEIRSAF